MRVACCKLRVACCKLRVACCRLRVEAACCLLRGACCMLQRRSPWDLPAESRPQRTRRRTADRTDLPRSRLAGPCARWPPRRHAARPDAPVDAGLSSPNGRAKLGCAHGPPPPLVARHAVGRCAHLRIHSPEVAAGEVQADVHRAGGAGPPAGCQAHPHCRRDDGARGIRRGACACAVGLLRRVLRCGVPHDRCVLSAVRRLSACCCRHQRRA